MQTNNPATISEWVVILGYFYMARGTFLFELGIIFRALGILRIHRYRS